MRARRVIEAPAVVRRFRAVCDTCPGFSAVGFYDEVERDRYAYRHSLSTTHSIVLIEETL